MKGITFAILTVGFMYCMINSHYAVGREVSIWCCAITATVSLFCMVKDK